MGYAPRAVRCCPRQLQMCHLRIRLTPACIKKDVMLGAKASSSLGFITATFRLSQHHPLTYMYAPCMEWQNAQESSYCLVLIWAKSKSKENRMSISAVLVYCLVSTHTRRRCAGGGGLLGQSAPWACHLGSLLLHVVGRAAEL